MDKGEVRGRGRAAGLSALGHLRVVQPEVDGVLQGFVDDARGTLGVGLCIVNLVLEDAQSSSAWSGGVPADLGGVEQSPRQSDMYRLVIRTGTPLVVEDLLADERFQDGYLAAEYGFRSYAGTPLISSDGDVVGCLCIFDSEPASFTEDDLALLAAFGRAVVARLELLGTLAIGRAQAGEADPGPHESHRMLDAAAGMSCTLGLDGTIKATTGAGPSMLGYEPEEIVGRAFVDLAHPDDRDYVAAMVSAAAIGRPILGARSRCVHKDGRIIPVEHDAALLVGEGVVRFAVRELGGGLARRESPLAGSFKGGTFGLDTRGEVTFVDEGTAKLTGWEAEEIIGRRMHDLIHHRKPDGTSYPGEECPIYGALADGNVHRGSGEVFWRQDGTSFPIEYVSTPINKGDGVVGAVVRFEDATERRRAEEEFEKQETRNKAVLDVVPDLVLRMGRDGDYLDVLTNGAGKLYLSRERMLGRNVRDVLPPTLAEGALQKIADALDSGEIQDYEYSLDAPEGTLTFEARFVASGPGEVMCIVRDITARQRTEEELRGAHQRIASHVENSPLGIIEWSKDAEVVRWSGEAEKMFGWSAEEVLGRRLFDDLRLIHEDDVGVVDDVARRLEAGERRLVVGNRNYKKDGSVVHCEWYNSVLVDEQGELVSILSLVLDVTEGKLVEEARREGEERLRSLTDAALEGIIISREGRVLEANRAACAMFGYEPREIVGVSVLDLTAPQSVDLVRRKISTGDDEPYEAVSLRRDGSVFRSEVHGRAYAYRGAEVRVAAVRDVTRSKAAEEALRKSEERYRNILDQIEYGYFEVDLRGDFVFVNGSMCRILGFSEAELIGANNRRYMDDETARTVYERFNEVYRTGEPISGFDWKLVRGDGETRRAETSVSLVRDDEGEPVGFRGILRDVTERKVMEEELARLAFHDGLTGLPNRALFADRLAHALERAGKCRDAAAVLFMDLDNFKYVNDSLGHETGDALLVEVAGRLKDCLREEDTVARIGGDEFCVLLEGVESPLDAVLAAKRIAEGLEAPFPIDGREIYTSASIGIALGASGGGHGDLPEELLRDADAAMYAAKGKGKSRYEVFTQNLRTQNSERLEIEARLRGATERGEFRVHYQPKILVADGEIVGFEALVRWEHPEAGLIPPGRFIPVAEDTGLIVPIGGWVLAEACRQAQAWRMPICVNLSARQFEHPGLVEDVARTLHETGLEPSHLTLEITESALMEDALSSVDTLEELKSLGVSLAIDDFGTGYSSLGYLKRFPADYLKIDRSFVDGLGKDANDTVLVSGMVGLAHALGLKVIAEGVETADQLARLHDLDCDLAQGYLISRPLPVDAATALLRRH